MSPRVIPVVVMVLCCVLNATQACPRCASSLGDESNTPFSSLEEAEISARCLTVCGEGIGGIRQSYVTEFGVWTSVDNTLLMTDNCPLFFETKECQLGCSLRSSASDVTDCRDTCRARCQESCSFTQSCGGSCPENCRGTWCRNGCEQNGNLQDLSDSIPSTPLGFTLQPRKEVSSAGLFDITSVNISQTAPEDGISAFLFRVELAEETLYVLQSSLTDALDLGFFSCREVNLSLAVVNRNGSSQFTSPTPVCVHGGIPSAPRNLRTTSTVEDLRTGFLGHAVITLEWDLPEERPEALTGYTLYVEARPLPSFPDQNVCGDPDNFTDHIAWDATSYVLRAESAGQLPQFGPQSNQGRCSYKARLTSLPEAQDNENDDTSEIRFNSIPTLSSPAVPEVNYSCERRVDTITGLVGISLNFSYEYNSQIQEGILTYTVSVFETTALGSRSNRIGAFTYNPGFVSELVTPVIVCSDRNLSSNFTLTNTNERVMGEIFLYNICPKEATDESDFSSHYSIVIDFSRNSMIWWRPLPPFGTCQQSGTTETPSVVNAETIKILTDPPLMLTDLGQSQYNVSLGVEWEPPLAPYGAEEYEVYIGGDPVDTGSQGIFIPTVIGKTDVILQRLVPLQDEQHLYLQIRSRNDFFLSNWSEPIDIISEQQGGGGQGSSSLPGSIIAAIVGVVVFLVLAVGVTLLVVFLYLNHHRRAKLLASLKGDHRDTLFHLYRGIGRSRSNREIIRKLLPMEDEWEIPPVALEVEEKPLGEGCFGQVYKGFVRGPVPGSRTMKDSIHTSVAIKYLKAKANSGERNDFVNEIDMMKKVAKVGNPHVVSLIGCITLEEPLCLIVEYLRYGDLLSYLHSIKEELALRKKIKKLKAVETSYSEPYSEDAYIEYGEGREEKRNVPESQEKKDVDHEAQPYIKPVKSEPQPYLKPVKSEAQPYLNPVQAVSMSEESPYANLGDVEPVNLISFAYQIAAGMEYLSSLEIVHRDLACRNVLVGDGKALKIADFGLSRVVSEGDEYVKTSAGRLPIKWMAIESISDRVFTVQSDVWAFGVVIWEIATLGGFPYPSIRNEELRDYLLQGNRLEKPPNCADQVYEMMLQCWQVNPAKRPKFSELRDTFESILMETSSYIQFSSLTDFSALGDSEAVRGPDPLPAVGKATNPYVTSPNTTQKPKQSVLSAPTAETAGTSSGMQSGDALSSPSDQNGSYVPMNPDPSIKSTLRRHEQRN